VELAAYGCKVPVYEFNKNEGRYAIVPKSGTSMAAPLVSFAAALLQGQTALSPAIIKKRLLISADYEPDLKRRVKNNAKLNIARSLALFHDVVQLKGGRPIYGRLNGDNFTIAVCGGTPLTRRELRSISVYKTPAASKIFVYHGVTGDQDKPDNSLEQKDCDLGAPNPYNPEDILADMEFEIENAETGIPHKFRMGDVSNITFAHAPYWEN
jgi:hypothetical protein